MEPDMTVDDSNFINLTDLWDSGKNNEEIWKFIDKGFIIYFVNANDHIEIGYDIDGAGNFRTIGGGGNVGIKKASESSFLQNKINGTQTRGVSVFLYLGYLKN
jgi:hypothetical protein